MYRRSIGGWSGRVSLVMESGAAKRRSRWRFDVDLVVEGSFGGVLSFLPLGTCV
jgi:hypothetical protein